MTKVILDPAKNEERHCECGGCGGCKTPRGHQCRGQAYGRLGASLLCAECWGMWEPYFGAIDAVQE